MAEKFRGFSAQSALNSLTQATIVGAIAVATRTANVIAFRTETNGDPVRIKAFCDLAANSRRKDARLQMKGWF